MKYSTSRKPKLAQLNKSSKAGKNVRKNNKRKPVSKQRQRVNQKSTKRPSNKSNKYSKLPRKSKSTKESAAEGRDARKKFI